MFLCGTKGSIVVDESGLNHPIWPQGFPSTAGLGKKYNSLYLNDPGLLSTTFKNGYVL